MVFKRTLDPFEKTLTFSLFFFVVFARRDVPKFVAIFVTGVSVKKKEQKNQRRRYIRAQVFFFFFFFFKSV